MCGELWGREWAQKVTGAACGVEQAGAAKVGSSVDKRVGAEVGKLVLVCGAEEGRLFSLVVFTPAKNPLATHFHTCWPQPRIVGATRQLRPNLQVASGVAELVPAGCKHVVDQRNVYY